nr:MAG TPA: hypothetical protein [Crassvirales sp.]
MFRNQRIFYKLSFTKYESNIASFLKGGRKTFVSKRCLLSRSATAKKLNMKHLKIEPYVGIEPTY